MNLKEKLEAVLKQMRGIVEAAEKAGRDLTDDEITQLESLDAEHAELKEKFDRAVKADAVRARIKGYASDDEDESPIGSGNGQGAGEGGRKGYVSLVGAAGRANVKSVAAAIQRGTRTVDPTERKSLVAVGATATELPLNPDPLEQKRIPTSLLEALPTVKRDHPVYAYLQQIARTNNAAIVASGGTKPTSVVTVERKENKLQVFAHISEPVDEYLLADNANLESFVATQLLFMLREKVEQEILAGDGTTGHLMGIMATSGVQTQAYAADKVTTLRRALLQLETVGHTGDLMVVNSVDWADIETQRVTSGSFDLGGPIDRATQKLWGVQVVTSPRIPVGKALVLDRSALTVDTDGVISTKWDSSAGFDKNQVRARVEGRFGLSVLQPAGIVIASLAGA